MSKRFGRNQKRRLREEIEFLRQVNDALRKLLFDALNKQAAESEPLCRPLETEHDTEQEWLG